MEEVSEPTLYVLMRTDLSSMNPGKAMAQAAHAADTMRNIIYNGVHQEFIPTYEDWKAQTSQGFGTTIVLGAAMNEIEDAIDLCVQMEYPAALVRDPTYPLRDGMVTHLISIPTCGVAFTPCRHDYPLVPLMGMELHP